MVADSEMILAHTGRSFGNKDVPILRMIATQTMQMGMEDQFE